MRLRLLEVSVSRAKAIGTLHGEAVLSGIDKTPIASQVAVRTLGIEGDEQADLSVHGGADKAIYAYPSEHWPWWDSEKHLPCRAATFGENLTTEGADEQTVAIGDRFRWDDCVLEVSQPRAPCYKLAMHTGRPDVPQAMTLSTRCGWYFRVVEEGRPVSRMLERIAASGNITVHDAFRALFDRHADRSVLLRVHDTPQLAEAWRRGIARKMG
ncbi:MAG: MOSC domain-containing protein [bacterium]